MIVGDSRAFSLQCFFTYTHIILVDGNITSSHIPMHYAGFEFYSVNIYLTLITIVKTLKLLTNMTQQFSIYYLHTPTQCCILHGEIGRTFSIPSL